MNIPLKAYWSLLVDYLRPQWFRVLLLAALLTGSIALQLHNPQILRRFLDIAISGTRTGALPRQALIFIIVALSGQFLSAISRYVGEQISWTATNNLRADLVGHCLKLDLAFHKSRTTGEMVERIDGDVNTLSNFFSQMFVDVFTNLVLMAGVLTLLFIEDWRAGLALSIFVGLTLYIMGVVRTFGAPFWARERQGSAELFGFLGEHLAGTEAIRSSGATGFVMRRFYEVQRRFAHNYVRAGMTGAVMWTSSLFIFSVGTALAFSLGAYLYRSGAITIGTVYLIFHYTELLRRPIEQIRKQFQDLQQASASITRVQELLQTSPRLVDGPGAPFPAGSLQVMVDNVDFAYAPGDPVLREITFELQPGAVLGLLGRTGSGKSTLARLLLRLQDPTAGEIRLGGIDLRSGRLDELRSRVGLVTQDVQLLQASVRDNLTFMDPQVRDEQIVAVLEELGLGAWFDSLPAGLDTELESGGVGLSAGEAQLLAFARVFLHDPGLVIMDEASSRLDPATEALVERAVTRLLQGRTGIIIAHRLSTVQRADTILILEGGKVLEHGNRERLAADPTARFHHLLKSGLEEVLV